MQLLIVRHALPERITVAEGPADPGLAELGHRQAGRLPQALAEYDIARIVTSPQRRARETAAPIVEATGLTPEVDEELAEYDSQMDHYIPIHEARDRAPEVFERIRGGLLPEFVDEDAFRGRVVGAIERVVAGSRHEDTVAVVAHGGVTNVFLQQVLGLPRPLTFPLDYTSITRVLVSRNGNRRVASVNETGHVRDLLHH
ncbi:MULTISPECIES: histidine phosphatase family protein [unclassified Rhodococcus (in: high G+C Gram-positive bacteria)]|uniref:histidine phosphatase family protein n=1 Tax=unclassified Rhodococcus (in: high G+C Gram-positive bacteria) TaxID=192944 RepID=UPI000E0B635D|nr:MULTISPECIES: histidine phosphatase family protein [unclassified Rhodococcus (in: high G+C Gram-positive bacteria)]QKT10122.1 histidine phosphatase family protein [Rhodococcus sp. W8901]RDI30253.1 putative phosphoglycerate mutase [Rhodococcus sp. AG1013]